MRRERSGQRDRQSHGRDNQAASPSDEITGVAGTRMWIPGGRGNEMTCQNDETTTAELRYAAVCCLLRRVGGEEDDAA